MTYATALPLQTAVYERLRLDPAIDALVGNAIHDGLPPGTVPPLYISMGEEKVTDRSTSDGSGARHDFTIAVVGQAKGFAEAKTLAAAVTEALTFTPLTPARGHLVGPWFRGATARRVQKDGTRRIDLRFRAVLFDT